VESKSNASISLILSGYQSCFSLSETVLTSRRKISACFVAFGEISIVVCLVCASMRSSLRGRRMSNMDLPDRRPVTGRPRPGTSRRSGVPKHYRVSSARRVVITRPPCCRHALLYRALYVIARNGMADGSTKHIPIVGGNKRKHDGERRLPVAIVASAVLRKSPANLSGIYTAFASDSRRVARHGIVRRSRPFNKQLFTVRSECLESGTRNQSLRDVLRAGLFERLATR